MNNSELRRSAVGACMANGLLLADYAGYTPTYSFAIMEGSRLTGGLDPDHEMAAASLNKLAIVHALEVSDVAPDTEMQLEASDIRPGNGRLQYFPLGFRFSAGEAATMALSLSDNTATRAIVRQLGGPDEVNELLHSRSPLRIGLPTTALDRQGNEAARGAPYFYGQTTAREAALLMWQLFASGTFADALRHGEFTGGLRSKLDENLGAYPTPRVERGLQAAKAMSRIPLLSLPKAAYQRLLHDLPPKTAFPNKQGHADDLRHDVAQIGRYTVAVLSSGHSKSRPSTL